MREAVPPALVIIGVLVVWEALVRVLEVPPRFLPAPSKILWAMWKDYPSLIDASWVTGMEAVVGMLVGIVLGIGIAAAIHLWKVVERSLYPLLIVSQTVPVVALAPLIIIWFGFDVLPKILLVAIYAVFPIAVGTARGLSSAPREVLDVVRSMGAGKRWRLLHVNAFAASGQFFNGVRVAATYAMSGATVAEFVGGKAGLGIYLIAAKASFRTDLVFAGALTTAVITLLFFGVVVMAERLATPWRRYVK